MTEPATPTVTTEPSMRCLVAMVDIRGYSEFAHAENDPVGVASFVGAALRHTLRTVAASRQLAQAVVKPTGDGLLFILNLEDSTQGHMANSALVMLSELQDVSAKFKSYLDVNPPAGLAAPPSALGVGVAFGPLVHVTVQSRDPALELDDYVGHTINLAARLQELARNGGCVVHADVYEKLLKHKAAAGEAFLSTFGERVEVRLRQIVGSEDTPVYASAQIPVEYLSDEQRLEDFGSEAMKELASTFQRSRSIDSHWRQLPEATRFILFKRETDSFRETVSFMVGQRIRFRTDVSIRIDGMQMGSNPIADAVLQKGPILVSYSVRYDECDVDDPNNEYWQQTKGRFPHTKIEVLRKLALHPASILAVPLLDRLGSVVAVAVFDIAETDVFNEAIAAEMAIRLPDVYERLFGSPEPEPDGVLEL
jgi:class 3 adenylate cyclase